MRFFATLTLALSLMIQGITMSQEIQNVQERVIDREKMFEIQLKQNDIYREFGFEKSWEYLAEEMSEIIGMSLECEAKTIPLKRVVFTQERFEELFPKSHVEGVSLLPLRCDYLLTDNLTRKIKPSENVENDATEIQTFSIYCRMVSQKDQDGQYFSQGALVEIDYFSSEREARIAMIKYIFGGSAPYEKILEASRLAPELEIGEICYVDIPRSEKLNVPIGCIYFIRDCTVFRIRPSYNVDIPVLEIAKKLDELLYQV
jgi:hypothetical protein